MGFKYYLSQRGKKYHIRLRYSFNKGSRHDFMIGVYLNDIKQNNETNKFDKKFFIFKS